MTRTFVVVSRSATSAIILPENRELRIVGTIAQVGEVTITYRTEYEALEDDSRVPRWLVAEVSGSSSSLSEAASDFHGLATDIAIPFAVSANASFGDLVPYLGFETTPGRDEFEFFQSMASVPPSIPRKGQMLPFRESVAVLRCFLGHEDQSRLYRAAAHYLHALDNWHPGASLEAVSHLWIGIEALTKAQRRQLVRDHSLSSETEIAKLWGIEIKKLDPEVRLRISFQGDQDCYQDAHSISEQIEHAYKPFSIIRSRSLEIREKVAYYLRSAIIELIGLDESSRSLLRSPRFETPLGAFPTESTLWTTIKNASGRITLPGERYPHFIWTREMQSFSMTDEGDMNGVYTDHITSKLASGSLAKPFLIEFTEPKPTNKRFRKMEITNNETGTDSESQ